MILYQKV